MMETFQKYSGSGLIISCFLLAWFYLLLKEKKKQNRVVFVYMPALLLVIFFNPIFFRIFENVTEEAIYFRFLWILPITVVIAYTIISIVNELKGKKKVIFGISAAILIMLFGRLVYLNPLFTKAENLYHVPWEVVEICDAIEMEGREIQAAFPRELLLYVRQYSAYVCMPYGREVFDYYDPLFTLMESDEIELEELAELTKQRQCHYVVLSKEKNLIGNLEDYSYEIYAEVGDYIVYCDNRIYKGYWDEKEE